MKKKKSHTHHKKDKFDALRSSVGSSNFNGQRGFYTYKSRKKKRFGKFCINFNQEKLTCKVYRSLCKNADECSEYIDVRTTGTIPTFYKTSNRKTSKHKIDEVGITAIVLNDNRKCTNDNHQIKDISAILRLSPITGGIINYEIPAAYCETCDAYFVLKTDFQKAKEHGIVLCPVIDHTQKHLSKIGNKTQTGNESRIHQLGYNVKKNNGYTTEQRHIVLANIIENTNISKYEITSNINRCIAQHQKQPNYAESVSNWINDLKFVNDYQHGDMPEVIINKVIIGRK